MIEYIIIERNKSDFQKVLNQWKHNYNIDIIWITYDVIDCIYRALITRNKKLIQNSN